MKIRSLELVNFQAYEDEYLVFPEGSTLIRGGIGSGKSTILRGIFAGLFQTDAKGAMPDIDELSDLIKFGEDQAYIGLVFSVNGDVYDVDWVLSRDGTERCHLSGRSLNESISGVTQVRDIIQNDILEMDAESFVNSVYVQQKELQRLLNADTSERKEILDGLLGLDRADEYIERMEKARPAATRMRDDANARVDELRSQLEEKEELDELRSKLTRNVNKIGDLETTIADEEQYLDTLQSRKESVEEEISEYRENESRLDELHEEHEELLEKMEEIEEKEVEIEGEIKSLEESSPDIDVDESQRTDAEEQVTKIREEKAELKSQIEAKSREIGKIDLPSVDKGEIVELEERIATIEDQIDNKSIERLREEKEELTNKKSAVSADYDAKIESSQSRLDDYEKIRENGTCPMCGQPVEEIHSHDRSDIKTKIEELENSKEKEINELEEEISELESQISKYERLSEELEQKEETLKNKREEHQRYTENKSELESLEATKQQLESQVEDIQAELIDAEERRDTIVESLTAKNQVQSLKQELATLSDKRDRCNSDIEELEANIKELEVSLGEIDDLESRQGDLESKITTQENELSDLREELSDLREEKVSLENSVTQVEDLKDRIEEARAKREWASDIREETESMIEGYESVKEDLRKKNIQLLNKYTNEVFRELYKDENYTRVEIGANYEIRMVRASGHRMKPSLASGGEGAILNLALRAAIYRLVSEKESRIGELPPFILDEPTQGMDNNHIRQLGELLRIIRGWEVSQIFIVSHQDLLGDMAEHEITVTITDGIASANVTTGG